MAHYPESDLVLTPWNFVSSPFSLLCRGSTKLNLSLRTWTPSAETHGFGSAILRGRLFKQSKGWKPSGNPSLLAKIMEDQVLSPNAAFPSRMPWHAGSDSRRRRFTGQPGRRVGRWSRRFHFPKADLWSPNLDPLRKVPKGLPYSTDCASGSEFIIALPVRF